MGALKFRLLGLAGALAACGACATGGNGEMPMPVDAAAVSFDARPDAGGSVPDGAAAGDGAMRDGAVPIDAAVPDAALVDAGACGAGATAIISEVAPNIPGGTDIVELIVKTAGTTDMLKLRMHQGASGASVLATLPAICVAAGDVIVVHLTPTAGNGNAPASETTMKNQYPRTTYGANYVGAWDVNGANTGITATDVVLTLSAADNSPMDGAVFSNMDGTSSATYTSSLAAAQLAGSWLPAACGGAACTDATTPSAQSLAADYSTVGTTVTGLTVQRTAATDTHTKADWAVATSTLGVANP